MPQFRVSEAAALLGVSDDTVRRWCDTGRLTAQPGPGGRQVVDGAQLAALATELATAPGDHGRGHGSARNRLVGLVTAIRTDTVMAQVEMQAGPYRVVALVSREAVDELGLEIGAKAVAVVKATNVTLEVE